jgi:GPH family glycoside/pentoside/hexuronide:cation symporter
MTAKGDDNCEAKPMSNNKSGRKISNAMLLTFSLPAMMQGFMHAPALAIVQGIYAKYTGISLITLGTAVMVTRIFDAVTDPIIGWVSDTIHRKTGSRKPTILIGTFVTAIGLWFLYRPPEDVTIVYFTSWFLIAYLGWTMTEIPYRAWSFELSSEHATRSKIQGWLGMALILGSLGFYMTPYITQSLGLTETTDTNLETLAYGAVVIVILMPLLNLITLRQVPNGEVPPEAGRPSARELANALFRNRPLMYFIAMFLTINIAMGVGQGVGFLFVDGYLGLGPQLAALYMLMLPATIISIPFWTVMCQRYERQKVWAISMSLTGCTFLAYVLIPTGGTGFIPAAILLVVQGLLMGCVPIASFGIMGDIIDYGRWKFGHDHGAWYMSFYSIVQKALMGVGVAVGFVILGLFAFDATTTQQSEQAIVGIKLVVAYIPGFSLILLSYALWRFPLTRAEHKKHILEIG